MGNGIFAMAMNPIHRQSLFKISNFILIAFLQWSTNTIKLHFLFAVLHGTMSCVQWRFITSTVLWYWFNFVYSFLVLFLFLSFFFSFFLSFVLPLYGCFSTISVGSCCNTFVCFVSYTLVPFFDDIIVRCFGFFSSISCMRSVSLYERGSLINFSS